MDFRAYLKEFEERVVLGGIASSGLGKLERVSAKNGSLDDTPFAALLGKDIDTDMFLVIDYYGYKKKSRGFKKWISKGEHLAVGKGKQVKQIDVLTVHFNSIRFEEVLETAPDMVRLFPEFKSRILIERGFK